MYAVSIQRAEGNMLGPEFRDFYDNWRRKAGEYVGDDDIRAAFDGFFKLWVIYNRQRA
jgi:hypothetical protein